jgi:DNA helicase-2/ATP-dependent DNA helicase PcrA
MAAVRESRKRNKPSPEQQVIYQNFIATRHNICIEATAGSGKTTTLEEISKLIPYVSIEKSQFCAFNRKVVKELRERLPERIKCSTLHSIGYHIVAKYYQEVKFSKSLQIKFLEPVFDKEKNNRKKWKKIYEADEVLQKIRATQCPLNEEAVNTMVAYYDMDVSKEAIFGAMKAARKLKEYLISDERSTITIDHQAMIEIPVLRKDFKAPAFDYVLLDEAQDASDLDLTFIEKLLSKGTRFIAVGDPNQSIYGFRGANANSWQRLKNRPNTITLPLSTSYRCSKAVVRRAQQVHSVIQAYEKNPEGSVIQLDGDRAIMAMRDGDFVLARNLRPLVDVYFQLVEMGKKATIIGKEFEKGLLGMLADYAGEDPCHEVLEHLGNQLVTLGEQLKTKGLVNVEKNPKYIHLSEKLSILRIILGKFDYVYEAEEFIQSVFLDEETDGIQLMTVHKSKGLENERVLWITHYEDKRLIPSPYASTPDQLLQEKNLEFVAITRAKSELIEVKLPAYGMR